MLDPENEIHARVREAAQDDLPVVADPFSKLAERHGVSEQELLDTLRAWQRDGIIRRYGALVDHRKLGYEYNALVAWVAPPERVEQAGRALADDPDVTHCYERVPAPGFPYNLYVMIHTHTEEECRRKIEHLEGILDLPGYAVLVSTRQFKKTSPRYGVVPPSPSGGAADDE